MGTYKNCQSCGIPFSKDPNGSGMNADGSKSEKYCSYCYPNGAFTFNGNVKEMQDFCRTQMINGGHSKFTAWLFSRGLNRLERWK